GRLFALGAISVFQRVTRGGMESLRGDVADRARGRPVPAFTLNKLPTSPTFLQWTVLPKIGSRPPCDRRLEEPKRLAQSPPSRQRCVLIKDDPRSHRGALRGAN